ncbi:MAG: peptidylprolyl isomerase [Thermodesulfobacteriota bacterium]|nr:peptidylprolyl isomerase [Thermodesulfobacteriota bacterium]
MKKAKIGDRVKVHYTAKLKDNTVFHTSKDKHPVEFEIGAGDIIPGLEKGVVGMKEGEKKTITIPPGDGFGLRREEFLIRIDKSEFADDVLLTIGQKIRVNPPNEKVIDVTVTDISEKAVVLDMNHPLAGYTLVFDIEMIEVI